MTHQKSTHHTERGRSLLESSSIASQQRQPSNSPDDAIWAPSLSSTSSHERPSSSGKHAQNSRSFPPLDSSSTLAQFSFAPATQTTVVTTTTTTTTKFPPIIMRAPRRIRDIDPKRFPLAATPTPPSLRKLCFNVAGKPSVFTEAEDANSALERVSNVFPLDSILF
jgi:F-box and WD-40 domain protein CDC4